MNQDKNAEVVRRHFENLWSPKGDLKIALEESCLPDVELRVGDEVIRGYEGFRGAREAIISGMPDMTFTIDDVISTGDRVALRWTGRGTHSNAFMGFPPTNKSVTYWGISIYELRDGKIARQWGSADVETLLAELRGERSRWRLKSPAQAA